MKISLISLTILLFSTLQTFAQTDSLVFENDNIVVGEIKSMDRGVLTIETDYSDSDFKIKWVDVTQIFTESFLLISTSHGLRAYGRLTTTPENALQIVQVDGDTLNVNFNEIVYLKSVDRGFWDRLNAAVDLGYTLTRARNQRQFTVRSLFGFITEKWSIDANYNSLISRQDDTEDIERIDANVSFRYVLPKEWFIIVQVDLLSNTEQRLNLRRNAKLGIGKYILRTNQYYWGVQSGISNNEEDFEGLDNDRNSQELWIGTELNLYDIGDLTLSTGGVVYPSLTEDDRVRVDLRIDLKYDLPLDFYIKTGYTLNYDNQPVEGGQRSDYIWQTTFGWEW